MKFAFGQPTVEDLLRNNVYVVPRFQRSYEWTEIEWEDLWADVLSARGDLQNHFMGPIVVSKNFNDESVPEFPKTATPRFVIDGQQRLVTLSIVLSRLHRKLDSFGLAAADLQAEVLRWTMLRDPLLPEQSSWPRVVLNDPSLQDTFTAIVDPQPQAPDKPKKAGRPPAALARLRKASEFFSRQIDSYLATSADPVAELARARELVMTIGRRLEFVSIEVDSEADAYTIFESLNARGMDLTAADLLKNLLLGRASRIGEQLDKAGIVGHDINKAVEESWKNTVEAIRAGFGERLPAFLRHYWIARHQFVREDRLYKEISAFVRDQTQTAGQQSPTLAAKSLKVFASDVASSAWSYVWLWAGEGESPYPKHPSLERIRARLNGIRSFNATQVLPVLLTALNRRIDAKRLEQLVIGAEVMIVRRSMAEQPPNRVERESGELCAILRETVDEGEAVNRVTQRFERLTSEGQEFDPFPTKTMSTEKAKHILLSLENHLRLSQNKEETLLDPNKVDIEHVLPQSPQDIDWPTDVWEGAEGQKAALDRLANYALLARNANRAVGNARFWCEQEPGSVKCCKRHTYLNSELLLTNEIGALAKWDLRELGARQARLAGLAKKVWPYRDYGNPTT
jgi:hypothetical protein